MSNYPTKIDTDLELPYTADNITEVGADNINAVRDAVFALETTLGVNPQGSAGTVVNRLDAFTNPDGTPKLSVLLEAGLVALPITNSQIAETAAIQENKLQLQFGTRFLFNLIKDLAKDVNTSLSYINTTGVKLNPHLAGANFRHILSHIDIGTSADYLKNKFSQDRDNTNSLTALTDLNNDFVDHQKTDGSGTSVDVITNGGEVYPSTYGHTASGIFVDTQNYTFLPQTLNDVQSFINYLDQNNLFITGTRNRTLFSNGISRSSRSVELTSENSGQSVIPFTPATTFLLNGNISGPPVDNIFNGDDVIELSPLSNDGYSFSSKFNLISVGDIATINYGSVQTTAPVIEKKLLTDTLGANKYYIRINAKNLEHTTAAIVKIDKSVFNNDKYGVLTLSEVNNDFNELPSLVVSSPRGAQALGVNFNPDLIDGTHYSLYLQLYPNGDLNAVTNFALLDVSGNEGATPGAYTLDSVVDALNTQLRKPGFNGRFVAYKYQGQFGIMLADSYNNTSFSIVGGVVNQTTGQYDQTLSNSSYPNNVIDNFNQKDALGLGIFNANIASPPYTANYQSEEAAKLPTKIIIPLKRNTYYVDGSESDQFANYDYYLQSKDSFGNYYWNATITERVPVPGRIETTYTVNLDLSSSGLKNGKTLVVQQGISGTVFDFGRFIIKDIQFNNCNTDTATTKITVYDSVHLIGSSPYLNSLVGTNVKLYFGDDSVSFDIQNAGDNLSVSSVKRHFEIFIDKNGHTFSQERARLNNTASNITLNVNPSVVLYGTSETSFLNVYSVSSKLKGYDFFGFNKLTLHFNSYDSSTGLFDGYVCKFDGTTYTNIGPTCSGKKGEKTRFYNETGIDYLDVLFNLNDAIPSFTDKNIDVQLYSSLKNNEEYAVLGTCQVNQTGSSKKLEYLIDERQFGNISEKHLSTSALDYISAGDRALHQNGVIRGFEVGTPTNEKFSIKGGSALVNGKVLNINNTIISAPILREYYNSTEYQKINWLLCVNSKAEFDFIALTDYDANSPETPSVSNRIFTAFNPLNSLTYKIESKSFEDIVNTRDDLAPLYIVTTVVTGTTTPTVATTLADVRKNLYKEDSSYIPTISDKKGNFFNLQAILNYIKYSNYLSSFNIAGTFNNVGSISLGKKVKISGQPAILNTDASVNLINVSAEDLSVISTNDGYLNQTNWNNSALQFQTFTSYNNNFNATTIDGYSINDNNSFYAKSSVNVDYTSIFNNVEAKTIRFNLIDDGGFNTAAIDNCDFYYENTLSFINSNINNSRFVSTTGNIVVEGDCVFTNCSFNVSVDKAITLSGSNCKFINCNFTNSYDTTADGYFSATNLVNATGGTIYSNTSVKNVIVENSIFINDKTNHYPQITLSLPNNTSYFDSIKITGNKFLQTNSIATDDIRAVIAIVSSATANVNYPTSARLINCEISGNTCSHNQMIIVSQNRVSGIAESGILSYNTLIRNNVCGTIGFFTGYSDSLLSVNLNLSIYNSSDKYDDISIINNTCKYIANLDGSGQYISFRSILKPAETTNTVSVSSGNYIISQNKVSWIHVGNKSLNDDISSGNILNNKFAAEDSSFLVNFASTSPVVSPPNVALVVRRGDTVIDLSNVLIEGNTFVKGKKISETGITAIYYYSDCIYLFANGKIVNNTMINAINDVLSDYIYLSDVESIVSNNKLVRSSALINSYISGPTTASNFSSIVENNFDGYTVNGTDELVSKNIPANWKYERNKNQTGYAAISITYFNRTANPTNSDNDSFRSTGFNLSGPPTGTAPNQTVLYRDIYTTNGGLGITSRTDFIGANFRINDAGRTDYSSVVDVSSSIPTDVKIIGLKVGIKTDGSARTPAGANYIELLLQSKNIFSSGTYASPINGSILDVSSTDSTSSGFIIHLDFSSFTTFNTTQYLEINEGTVNFTGIGGNLSDNNLKNDKTRAIAAKFRIDTDNTGSGTQNIYISPIVVKYRW